MVTVDGGVKKGGALPVMYPMTLMSPWGFREAPMRHRQHAQVPIFRTLDGKRQAVAFDLLDTHRAEMPHPVYSAHIIIVDGSSSKAITKNIFPEYPAVKHLPAILVMRMLDAGALPR